MAVVEAGGERYLELTFRRRTGGVGDAATAYTVDGITYLPQANLGLDESGWQSGAGLFVAVGAPVNNGDGTETVAVRVRSPLGSNARIFVRLRVVRVS